MRLPLLSATEGRRHKNASKLTVIFLLEEHDTCPRRPRGLFHIHMHSRCQHRGVAVTAACMLLAGGKATLLERGRASSSVRFFHLFIYT